MGFIKKSPQTIFVCETNPDFLWLLSFLEDIIFLLVSFLFHPGAVGRFQVSFIEKNHLQ